MFYSCREEHLKLILAGLQKTGIPLIEFDGSQIFPALVDDDIGMYVLIPQLAHWFNLPLNSAISLFFGSICYGAALIGVAGFYKLFRSWKSRLIALGGILFLTKLCTMFVEVYCIPAAIAMAIIPWAIYCSSKQKGLSWYSFLFLTGIGCGLAHYVRAHAGTAPLIFLVTLILFSKSTKKIKAGAFITILAGLLIPAAYFSYALCKNKIFVRQELPDYSQMVIRHPIWHTIYAGFGFITNDFGLFYNDDSATSKVATIDPTAFTTVGQWKNTVASEKYETVMRSEVLQFIKHHWFYVMRVMAAKAGVLLFYLLLFANFGLLALFRHPLSINVAFATALAWSALPGLIAIPNFLYLTGFITFAVLYCILGLVRFIEKS
jgi:hypothetical protein